jgi:phospholipid/cholesterol/gamma-HCH transport system substrate-binding protein
MLLALYGLRTACGARIACGASRDFRQGDLRRDMPSQQEVRWSQLKVGVIVLVSSVILTVLLFLMTSSSGLGVFSRKLTVTTYFENSAGLKLGAAVNLEGVTIGTVKNISVVTLPERKLTPVMVVMKLDSKYQPSLHTDSTAALTTVGVLGDTVVDINSQNATGPPLSDGDELKTLETPSIQDVVKASQGTIESLNVVLAKLNTVVDNMQSGKGSFGQLLTNPALYDKFTASADQINQLTAKLNRNDNTVGKFFNDNAEMYNRLNETVTRVDEITKGLQNGKGSAGKVLTDDALYNNANASLQHLNSILSDADAGKGSVGMLIKDPAFARSLNDALTKTDALVTAISEGKGTLGKLATDDAAYNNANKLLTESTSLVTAIRQDPKKYLTIHMKIF